MTSETPKFPYWLQQHDENGKSTSCEVRIVEDTKDDEYFVQAADFFMKLVSQRNVYKIPTISSSCTQRGFQLYEFRDCNNQECSLQASSVDPLANMVRNW